ncbi:hypothetical protein THTE_0931 [Thermogutta terrifontis]|uniref:Uncharacterized protein n=1 Tax=Thermogutta terrifontis TaxID=1331910 RepID=A0A286RC35_9BACT|nr:hypothetical protein THTE_0931 [Thermogutta terrifontis]
MTRKRNQSSPVPVETLGWRYREKKSGGLNSASFVKLGK